MNANFFINLEKTAYPTGKVASNGQHLRQLTTNQSSFVPTVTSAAFLTPLLPIGIPTNRSVLKNRKNIRRLMRLAVERDNSCLIFLCSGAAKKDDIALLAKDFPGLQWLAIDGPFPGTQTFKTTRSLLYGGAIRDQAEKRNLVLQLARLMHWNKVFFLDDDVTITNAQIDKACVLLEQKDVSVVGFSTRDFPDLSVAMHAYRWIHDDPDSFIGGGALAVKVKTSFASFFPQTYNEDWLFLLAYHLAGAGKIVWAGTIWQNPFNPFKSTRRAVGEEAGDLVAEGLYKLAITLQNTGIHYKNVGDLAAKFCKHADEDFWNAEINNRLDYLHTVREEIGRKRLRLIRRAQAMRALNQAIEHILDSGKEISGKNLADWTKAWCEDVAVWNRVSTPKKPHKTITDAMNTLSLMNSYTGNIDMRSTTVAVLPRTEGVKTYQGHTLRTRTRTQKEALWLTQVIQRYFADKNLKMEEIAASANSLRFDRPAAEIPTIKPNFTICIVVHYGESVALLRQSVALLRKWVQPKGSCQIVISVYSNDIHRTHQQLEAFRNRITSQLVYDLASSDIQLRSSISLSKKRTNHVIESLLNDISFAYWKIGIHPDHPIFVVNSCNELLHLSTFGQFIHQEQQLPYQSTRQIVEALPSAVAQTISAEHDDRALEVARQRLVQKSLTHGVRFGTATKRMVRRMKRAKLTWLEQDDLAYSLIFHSAYGRNSIDTIKQTLCISVAYEVSGDRQAVAGKIIKQVKLKEAASCLVVVYSESDIPWKVLDKNCRELMKIVTEKSRGSAVFISMTYRFSPGETSTTFKRRILSTMEYGHWLQNHDEQIAIKWHSLG